MRLFHAFVPRVSLSRKHEGEFLFHAQDQPNGPMSVMRNIPELEIEGLGLLVEAFVGSRI